MGPLNTGPGWSRSLSKALYEMTVINFPKEIKDMACLW